MKYGIAIFPSKKLQDIANALRKRYDPNYAAIPPHVTLKSPFEITDNNIQQTIDNISTISEKTSPFSLNVYKLGTFHPTNNVIYLKVQENEELTKLHRQLNEGVLKHEDPYNFVPHITIAQELADAEHADVYGSLNMRDINHEEIVDRFQLLYMLENDRWTVYETFHLGNRE